MAVEGGGKGVLEAALGMAKQVEVGAKTGVWGVIKVRLLDLLQRNDTDAGFRRRRYTGMRSMSLMKSLIRL